MLDDAIKTAIREYTHGDAQSLFRLIDQQQRNMRDVCHTFNQELLAFNEKNKLPKPLIQLTSDFVFSAMDTGFQFGAICGALMARFCSDEGELPPEYYDCLKELQAQTPKQ